MCAWAHPSPIASRLRIPPSIDRLPSASLAFFIPSPVSSSLPRISWRSGFSLNPRRFRKLRIWFSAASNGPNPPAFVEGPAVDEAREAVMEMLQEFGASEGDSTVIASNSPKYIEMLVGNVRELDEHGLWSSWNAEMEEERVDFISLSFKKNVYRMAKSKGDGGILPLLESIGLKLSSAMLIARYLSSERLPELIEKVKFVKEMLFSNSGYEVVVGRNAKRMMMHLSIFIDEDIQSTLSFFEKMEARHGVLNMIAYEDASFPYMIESFPRLLLCSTENHLKPLVGFLELVGVSKARISAILLSFPPIIFYDIEKEMKPRIRALEKVPKSSVDLAIKSWPHLLGCSIQKLKLIVEQLNQLGVNKKMLVPVITSSPQLLLKKPNEFLEVVSYMEEVGFDGKTIGRILCRCPEIFAASVDNTLRKKVKFLTDFGISKGCLPRVIRKYPELLLLDINNTLMPRMRYLMGIGLSKREVCSMICKFSPLLGYSIEIVLNPKLEFFLSTMKKPLKELVEYPRYFSYSLDKKIKPRFWILKTRNVECSLKDMLAKNDEDFAAEYMGIGRLLVVPSPVPKGGEN
ncbi:transcription termination factor MTERF2, chloroplastic isoform X2 [Phoenix dactylifera]|uniref:Transcription termination factor MTERF2, chloroplastic isoform X2 n=1 Tax=Phoenix dactylifera TaxID=42345 RepID=A0A8B9ABN1_PHODC|nr:transcription termination factor MTERF2, chloroplastic isoform X2 [Phoenix dactylifera]